MHFAMLLNEKREICEMIKISVIIPVFNGERFIAEAIQSVLNQNYELLEIIVVDDGSTDNTGKIVEKFGSKVHYIFQENGGVAKARNTGLRAASGDYIAFLDADDLFCKDKLSTQLKQFDKYLSLGIAFGYASRCDFTGQIYDDEAKSQISKSFLVSLGSLLIAKSVFATIGYFDEVMKLAEDQDFFLRVRESGIPVAVHPEVVQICRSHDNNMTNDKKNRSFYHLLAIKKAIKRREKLNNNIPADDFKADNVDDVIKRWHTASSASN